MTERRRTGRLFAAMAVGVLVIAALVLLPRGIQIERYEQVALLLTGLFGSWGFVLFAAALGIAWAPVTRSKCALSVGHPVQPRG